MLNISVTNRPILLSIKWPLIILTLFSVDGYCLQGVVDAWKASNWDNKDKAQSENWRTNMGLVLDVEGLQNKPPPNMSLLHEDYFLIFIYFLKSFSWVCFNICFCFLLGFFCFLGGRAEGKWDPRFPTRDWNCTPYIGRWSLNHWATRAVSTVLI